MAVGTERIGGAVSSPRASAGAVLLVRQPAMQAFGQRVRVAGSDEQAVVSVLDQLGDPAMGGSDDRDPGGHRLDDRDQAEPGREARARRGEVGMKSAVGEDRFWRDLPTDADESLRRSRSNTLSCARQSGRTGESQRAHRAPPPSVRDHVEAVANVVAIAHPTAVCHGTNKQP
ncbi:MAG: hypothetical protein KDB80_10220 [Planctomycetes bacterium]|nr:hypothetical protein [Planctomycetota bacterium]